MSFYERQVTSCPVIKMMESLLLKSARTLSVESELKRKTVTVTELKPKRCLVKFNGSNRNNVTDVYFHPRFFCFSVSLLLNVAVLLD